MMKSVWSSVARFAVHGVMAACVAGALAAGPAAAMDDAPKPKIDCTKKDNKTNPKCQKSLSASETSSLNDDELYNAAYWLSRQGDYAGSLALLKQVANKDVPRVLNATGFATRKLGDVDGAFPFYARALTLDPNYTKAREYLGEAHLSKGDVAAAKIQLTEIATRCGTACSGYPELAAEIAKFENAGKQSGQLTNG
jgi:tetratricopeptide (TPR) repeat protein